MNNKKKNEVARRQEDKIFNHILIWFAVLAGLACILLWIAKYYSPLSMSDWAVMQAVILMHVMDKGRWVTAILSVLSALWLLLALRKPGKGYTKQLITFLGCLTATVIVFVTRYLGTAGTKLLCGVVLGGAVLVLVYYLYQREFLVSAVLAGAGLVGVWGLRQAGGKMPMLVASYMLAVIVVTILVALMAFGLQKNDGVFEFRGAPVHIFPKKGEYPLVYITCGLVALAVLAALLGGVAVAYYMLFLLVAWIFVMAVYFTVKLM